MNNAALENGPSAAADPGAAAPEPVPQWRRTLRRLLRRRMAVAGAVLVLLFLLLALVGPLVTGSQTRLGLTHLLAGPSGAHPLGTDDLGRDVLARITGGARVSLLAGVVSTALALVVGVPLGLAAGYYRGWADSVLMRLTDLVLSFPYLVFAVGMAAILGPSLRNVIIALAVAEVPSVVRIVRGETLVLRSQDFVEAAVADGARDAAVMWREILPNMTNTLIVKATVAIPAGILGEAALSFLGLGVQPPQASWGVMLTSAQQFLSQDPLLAVFPGVAIALTTLGFNLLGDGLRDVLDPRELL
ncbi:glutathione ABC transporter permease GsiD [Streptomyces sulfonofaciens]|uniref:Glutathione ABC transporter permease GsiD n=1 Tax=Streptomyces sulfonofaciens TaxID=68272 RepID=A0A919FT35_9ACTN|nr:ABC transporter permease [Streptomyces sulfonofaciens]GHH71931.1 glutathione ABC transporter permease GsiD [Streptomyces sulfonofaciens]